MFICSIVAITLSTTLMCKLPLFEISSEWDILNLFIRLTMIFLRMNKLDLTLLFDQFFEITSPFKATPKTFFSS